MVNSNSSESFEHFYNTEVERRLARDLKEMIIDGCGQNFQAARVSHGPCYQLNASPLHWEAAIFGFEDSIWAGGSYSLKIDYTEDYPNKPPKAKFDKEVFHPNVGPDGTVDLDILHEESWSSKYTIDIILEKIAQLLTNPKLASPVNSSAADLYTNNYQEYCNRVKTCVENWNEVDSDAEISY